jgi:hypothetical protein
LLKGDSVKIRNIVLVLCLAVFAVLPSGVRKNDPATVISRIMYPHMDGQTAITANSIAFDYVNNTVTVTGTRGGAATIVCSIPNLSCTLNGGAARSITNAQAGQIAATFPPKVATAYTVTSAYQSDPVQ